MASGRTVDFRRVQNVGNSCKECPGPQGLVGVEEHEFLTEHDLFMHSSTILDVLV